MTRKIEIRAATPNDTDTLKQLSANTITASYPSFLGDAAVAAYVKSGMVDHYIDECIGDCIVITLDKRLVGFCVCKQELIDLLIIDHRHHCQGLGRQLLRYCEQTLFSTYSEITLESFSGNDKANAFYLKNGWIKSKILFDPASGREKIIFYKKADTSGSGR